MAASTDAQLTGESTFSSGLNPNPMLDLRIGGQNGRTAVYGGMDLIGRYEEWQSSKPYVRRNIIPKIITYPKGFDYLPNSDLLYQSLTSFIEQHLITIDGLNSKLTVNFGEYAFGNTQETFEEVTNVTREKSSISATTQELEGFVKRRFMEFMIKYLYKDPDTKIPRITSFLPDEFTESRLYLPEMDTFSVLFIEPDILYRRAVNAWYCFNMRFRDGGDNIGRKNQADEGELVEYSLSFSSITMNDELVLQFANKIFQEMNIHNILREDSFIMPVEDIDETIKSNETGKWEGYKEASEVQ